MKTAIVPAQITTVEDKIAGSLTLQQMILLAGPVFIDFGLYVALPSMLKLNAYKLILMSLVALVSDVLAIRIKGKILLVWAVTIFRYNVRPRYYVFNKNSDYLRAEQAVTMDGNVNEKNRDILKPVGETATKLSYDDVVRLEGIMAHPSANLSFATTKKGSLYVSITEIK